MSALGQVIEIITSPMMLFFGILLVFCVVIAERYYQGPLTKEQKQQRNRKLRSEYGKSTKFFEPAS